MDSHSKINSKPLNFSAHSKTLNLFFPCYGKGDFRRICIYEGQSPFTCHMPQIPDRNGHSKPKSLLVQYHVRGRRKRQPLTTHCETVHDIIDLGQQSFPAFADRNPWICIDSKHGTVFVGLDPERPAPKGHEPPSVPSGNRSLDEESIEQ